MESFEIGGRKFDLAAEGSARKDMFTMRQIAACGENTIAQYREETEEGFIFRLYMTALKTGDVFLLLGALLVPEGAAWSEKVAKETADFLGELTDPEDKKQIRILLASALMPFFVSGRRSSKTFPSSSPKTESDRVPTMSGERSSTETGDSSSAKLQDGILSEHSES